MANNVCSQCGAPVTSDGKFCPHCGAKVDDGVQRAEIKIDNVAEVKRADYEAQESLLRQKRMKSEMLRKRMQWIFAGTLAVIGVVLLIIGVVDKDHSFLAIGYGLGGLVGAGALALRAAFIK